MEPSTPKGPKTDKGPKFISPLRELKRIGAVLRSKEALNTRRMFSRFTRENWRLVSGSAVAEALGIVLQFLFVASIAQFAVRLASGQDLYIVSAQTALQPGFIVLFLGYCALLLATSYICRYWAKVLLIRAMRSFETSTRARYIAAALTGYDRAALADTSGDFRTNANRALIADCRVQAVTCRAVASSAVPALSSIVLICVLLVMFFLPTLLLLSIVSVSFFVISNLSKNGSLFHRRLEDAGPKMAAKFRSILDQKGGSLKAESIVFDPNQSGDDAQSLTTDEEELEMMTAFQGRFEVLEQVQFITSLFVGLATILGLGFVFADVVQEQRPWTHLLVYAVILQYLAGSSRQISTALAIFRRFQANFRRFEGVMEQLEVAADQAQAADKDAHWADQLFSEQRHFMAASETQLAERPKGHFLVSSADSPDLNGLAVRSPVLLHSDAPTLAQAFERFEAATSWQGPADEQSGALRPVEIAPQRHHGGLKLSQLCEQVQELLQLDNAGIDSWRQTAEARYFKGIEGEVASNSPYLDQIDAPEAKKWINEVIGGERELDSFAPISIGQSPLHLMQDRDRIGLLYFEQLVQALAGLEDGKIGIVPLVDLIDCRLYIRYDFISRLQGVPMMAVALDSKTDRTFLDRRLTQGYLRQDGSVLAAMNLKLPAKADAATMLEIELQNMM